MSTKSITQSSVGDVPEVWAEVHGQAGLITLQRPTALNALTLPMIRSLSQCLLVWRDDPRVQAVAIRGSNKAGPFGSFCAGGDIRFFHQAALSGSPELGQFFTEEYALNHLIHTYPKPYIAFMDGVVMGGGMGISQGAAVRIVTERTRMAMPETNIGLFPDVGGGYFLSRCPGHIGEWLALTGETIGVGDALDFGLADVCFSTASLASAWSALASSDLSHPDAIDQWSAMFTLTHHAYSTRVTEEIDHCFSQDDLTAILAALKADPSTWSHHTLSTLRRRSPLMLHVVLAQIRRARTLSLADDLRMERDLVEHCFHPHHLGREAAQSETVEGIRAIAIDKDNAPRWRPGRIEDVSAAMVEPFFKSPWSPDEHPLRHLQ